MLLTTLLEHLIELSRRGEITSLSTCYYDVEPGSNAAYGTAALQKSSYNGDIDNVFTVLAAGETTPKQEKEDEEIRHDGTLQLADSVSVTLRKGVVTLLQYRGKDKSQTSSESETTLNTCKPVSVNVDIFTGSTN
ncbi:hypothetical protein EB796_006212 [Bugula neritina]|uniref:Uncharacterized protein n=1 Tax=Bugula neritina TaxID=10212 RepID=A0A7J7KC20_BUGNE|nr:hypothetical protein EB796_006212 [Bugula neritina]